MSYHFSATACARRTYREAVPMYDVECATHGVQEAYRRMNDETPFCCALCGADVTRRFSVPHERIDDMENIGADRHGSLRGVHLGLPGVTQDIGGGRTSYRPRTGAEIGSNRRAKEIAKRAGLTMVESGAWRVR